MWLKAALLWLLPSLALAGTANLTWTAPTQTTGGQPVTGANALTGYRLYERCGSAQQSLVDSPSASSVAATRTTPDGVTCWWQLSAVNQYGESVRTAEVSQAMPPVTTLPGAPANLVITWAPTQGQGPPSMAATVISAEVLTLEFNSDPAAVNITIPSDATAVYAFLGGWVSGGSGNPVVSVTLNGNNPSQSFQLAQSGDAPHGAVSAWYNPATGTQSLNYDVNFSPSEGNVCTVVYVKGGDTTAWRDADAARSTGATAISVTLDTVSGDLVILFDQRWSATAPGTPSGFTSVTTQTNYGSRSSRVSYISATGSTQVATAENESYSGIVAISIPAGAASGAMEGSSANAFGHGSSTLTGAGALSGTAAQVFGHGSSALTGSGALAGTAAQVFGAGSSTLTGAGALAGTAANVFGAGSSTLTGAGALAGTAAQVFGAGATVLTGDGALAGVSALTFTPEGNLLAEGDGAMTGASALVFGAGSSTLTGAGELAGESSFAFTVEGDLTGSSPGAMEGSTASVFTPVGTLIGTGELAGEVTLSFSLAGLLTDANAPPEPEAREQPAGRSKARRHKYYVEIDGQEFVVDSVQAAYDLLQRAKALAAQQAEAQAEVVVQRALQRARRVGKAEPVRITPPKIEAPPEVASLKADIEAIYRDAAIAAETRLLLELKAEQDDEEVLLLM